VTGDASSATTARLVVRELTAGYTDVPLISGVTLELAATEIVVLLGANGAGKTTILRAIMGLLPVARGQVVLEGTHLGHLPVHERVKAGLALVPAGRRLFFGLSVADNLRMGCYLNWKERVLRDRISEVFALFPELERLRSSLAGKLSGGEQQMVAIGRALMSRPRVLLVDELSLGLAPVVVERLMPALERIRTLFDIPILFVEQDIVRAVEFADRAYVLDRGRIAMEGKPKQLAQDRRLIRAYLGV
jgi:branched-chain amino acid transport system ATP-binding protein